MVTSVEPTGADSARVAEDLALALDDPFELLRAPDSLAPNLVVVGAGAWSDRVVTSAHCPVLVLPRLGHVRPLDWRSQTVVCGFDGSPGAWAAAMYAALLAGALHGSVTLTGVGATVPSRMSAAASTLRAKLLDCGAFDAGLSVPLVHWHTREGDPAAELERAAVALVAPLVVGGRRGDGVRDDAPMGSLTRRLLRSGRLPVVVT
jgi:nucleotide-binding universal stress UspA family protein